MANVTFDQLMKGFGVVTVMNATIYKLNEGHSYVGRGACPHGGASGEALRPSDFYCTGLYLDTLKIANLNQEGPTKTITGGQYANPLIKYGKTMTCEMQDALGRQAVMTEFFGCKYDKDTETLSIGDTFPGPFAIEGDTFFIDQKSGEQVSVHIFIPQFIPDGILNLTQDAEGDATVFDLNGTLGMTEIVVIDKEGQEVKEQESDKAKTEKVFYQIRSTSWFENAVTYPTDRKDAEDNYHEEGTEHDDSPTGE